ncbi:MAG: DUF6179 domain-containing protein, partial [Clostridia bacterium]
MMISDHAPMLPKREITINEEEIMEILREQALLFTKEKSGSLPVEIMAELRDSIYFTIHEALLAGEDPSPDCRTLFIRGRRQVDKEIDRAKELWLMTQVMEMPIKQRSYNDTIGSIGSFFSRYQPNFFAHQIPCDIDYPLFRSVPEDCLGVRYI